MRVEKFAGRLHLLAPLVRIDEVSWWGRVLAAAAAAVQAMVGDIFTGVILAAAAFEALDWYWGRLSAKKRGDFSVDVAALGRRTKILDVLLIVGIRLIEAWLGARGVVHTGGFVATAIAAGLLADNADSIEAHRQELGLRPLWGVSHAVRAFRALSERFLPPELRSHPKPEKSPNA